MPLITDRMTVDRPSRWKAWRQRVRDARLPRWSSRMILDAGRNPTYDEVDLAAYAGYAGIMVTAPIESSAWLARLIVSVDRARRQNLKVFVQPIIGNAPQLIEAYLGACSLIAMSCEDIDGLIFSAPPQMEGFTKAGLSGTSDGPMQRYARWDVNAEIVANADGFCIPGHAYLGDITEEPSKPYVISCDYPMEVVKVMSRLERGASERFRYLIVGSRVNDDDVLDAPCRL